MLGFATIGCGTITHMHASSVNELDLPELRVVADVDGKKRAEEFALKHHFEDLRD